MLLVAYPNYGATTEFKFKYWIGAFSPPPATFEELIERIKNQNWKGDDGTKALIIAAVLASLGVCFGLMFLYFLGSCIRKSCCNNNNEVDVDLEDEKQMDDEAYQIEM